MFKNLFFAFSVIIFTDCLGQTQRPIDTPEAFFERLKNGKFTEVVLDKTEHREFCKAISLSQFFWDTEPRNEAIEQELDAFHEIAWKLNASARIRPDWVKNWLADATFTDVQIDSSESAVGSIFFEKWRPKSVRAAQITAKFQLPGESKPRVLRAPVCRVFNGKWKLYSALATPQIYENDTPEVFFERLKTALAASTRQQFDDEIMISKSEHREFCKVKVPYKWDFWPTDPNVEKSLDEMHEFEWNSNLPRRQMSENWLDGEQGIWANATISKVEMDTSDAVVPRKKFQQGEWPQSVEVAFFSAYFQFPGGGEPFRVIAPVCRISGGRWKLVEVLRVHR